MKFVYFSIFTPFLIQPNQAFWFFRPYKANPMESDYKYSTNTNIYQAQRQADSFQKPKITGSYF